jgi:5-methylcytosine-specific restriction endonuclease McrA
MRGVNQHRWNKLKTRFKADCRARRAQCWLGRHDIGYDLPATHPDAFVADHYHPRSTHPWLTYEYSNLRPCCNRCNWARRASAVGGGEWVQPSW